MATNQPQLSLQAHDPDGDALTYMFALGGDGVWLQQNYSPQSSYQVPPSKLDPATEYFWTACVRDAKGLTACTGEMRFKVQWMPVAAEIVSTPDGNGYWTVDSKGKVQHFGNAVHFGDLTTIGVSVQNIVGLARTADGGGYWIVGGDGGVFSFGNAQFYGSMGDKPLNARVVGMSPTQDGQGYWLVAQDGGVFSFGNAVFHGSMGGQHLNAPVVGMGVTKDGGGYWLVAQDGGIFAFGNAQFHGSMGGQHLAAPITDMVAHPSSGGYWLAGEDGGVFAFGNAPFLGSKAQHALPGRIVAMETTPTGNGYWLLGCDGSVYEFGSAPQLGSAGGYACRGTVGMTCVDTKPEQACGEKPTCLMAPNTSWAPGTERRVCDGGRFVHQSDGNVVFYDKHNQVAWQWGSAGATHALNMQSDGNLVLYRPQGPTGSGTNGHPGAWLEVKGCNLMIRNLQEQVVWQSNTTCPAPPPTPWTSDGAVLPSNRFLPVHHKLTSPSGNSQLQMQGDGNVVLWSHGWAGWQPLWQTHTSGYPSTGLVMQHDGNLVQYGAGGAYWSSVTQGNQGAWAQIQDDCNFVVYRADATPLWASNTRCPPPVAVDWCGHSVQSGYGPFKRCYRTTPTEIQIGNYAVLTGSFTPVLGGMTVPANNPQCFQSVSDDGAGTWLFCGGGTAHTAYGPVSYGEQRLNVGYGPFVRWGSFNYLTGRFYAETGWMQDLG